MTQVYGTVFKKKNMIGDFDWMIRSGNYDDSLFIFNDDEQRHKWKKAGRGNAIIRKYNRYALPHQPHSAGIVTGKNGSGYEEFTDEIKQQIDQCFQEVKEILKTHNYKKVYYSAKEENGQLGTSIFKVHSDVLQYITEQIHLLSIENLGA